MKAVFISDAHLRCKKSARYSTLMDFLTMLRGSRGEDFSLRHEGAGEEGGAYPPVADHLYILGDFFDFWFHRADVIYPDFKLVIDRLIELKNQGISVYLFEGNHDFFLEKYFSKMLGMTVFPEWGIVEMDGRRLLLAHGDTVDGTNRKYLLLRSILRSNFFYRFQMSIPLPILWQVARASSDISKELSGKSLECLVREMRSFALTKLHEGFDAVILGHCHSPMIEEYAIDGRKKTFVTLGDWINHYTYLTYNDGRFTLSNFRPGLSYRGDTANHIEDC